MDPEPRPRAPVPWPWRARRSRVQVVALVLISVLALGPVAALIVVLGSDGGPVRELIPPADQPRPEDEARVAVTTLGLSPTLGELRVRLAVEPPAELTDLDGRLTEPITVRTNDTGGNTSRSFDTGAVVAPFEIAVSLAEGSITRYPVDEYQARLLAAVTRERDGETVPVPVTTAVTSTIGDFVIEVSPTSAEAEAAGVLVDLTLDAHRPTTTTVYAIWLMVLMWGLAVTGLLICWAVVIWRVDMPFWVFGYFVGVLFALPPLRDSLPGRPPPGTIFDFVSFYWSITIVGASLVLVLVIWIRRTRWEAQATGRP